MSDPRIVPGAWVNTCWGPAVAIEIAPHKHRIGPPAHLVGADGICHCACENDECKDASNVTYRYQARRPNEDKDIWVLNGDLTTGPDAVTFLRDADAKSTYVLTLTGPYGEGPILPPLPPEVVPAGPVRATKATFEEVDELFSQVWLDRNRMCPSAEHFDYEATPVFQMWDTWESETLKARLAEVGWTIDEYDEAQTADLRAYIDSLSAE